MEAALGDVAVHLAARSEGRGAGAAVDEEAERVLVGVQAASEDLVVEGDGAQWVGTVGVGLDEEVVGEEVGVLDP